MQALELLLLQASLPVELALTLDPLAKIRTRLVAVRDVEIAVLLFVLDELPEAFVPLGLFPSPVLPVAVPLLDRKVEAQVLEGLDLLLRQDLVLVRLHRCNVS